ncbi:MAG: ABC transporter substrate-binding protein [Desulfobacteraceae bacterium]|nr:ABC transporter substrate-binding protein [Pseudomonadota bacterium]MBU4463630.1 ABC transporter substrate-binding protein [Pseudomonadota bacterium]MCG2755196.1 ABC transporter substrate-binding protein [Desulfobacteraceae bacterium]
MKKILRAVLILTLTLNFLVLAGCGRKEKTTEILIGGIFDQSGATGDVGAEYADGVIDYVRHVNEKGGINGRAVKLLYKDYAYKISEAYTWYEEMKRKGVIAIVGWGTGDTEALAPKITADKIPFLSASYSDKLADGKSYPYNFIGATSYSDQARIALKFIKNESKEPNPKVAFIYNDTAFGRSPFFPGAENFAKEIGVNVVEKIVIPLSGEGAKEKLQMMEAQWAIVQETGTASVAIMKALKELKKDTKLVLLNWAIDENIAKQAGDIEPDTVYGTIPYGVWDDDLPGVKLLHEINAKYHPNVPERSCRYIQGYINIRVLLEAVKMAGDDLRSEVIKEKLENLENFDTGASFNRVSFSNKMHKPSTSVMVYKLTGGKIVPQSRLLTSIERKIWEEY